MRKRPTTSAPTRLRLTLGLAHQGEEAVVALASGTYIGQAHFGGSGPPGATCRECNFWAHTNSWEKSTGGGSGQPRPATCAKAKSLAMARVATPKVPHHALACRHFEPAERPQPIHRPARESWS
jgi:hypothetical protein